MRGIPYQSGTSRQLAILLLAIPITVPIQVNGAERVVLGEEFTATW